MRETMAGQGAGAAAGDRLAPGGGGGIATTNGCSLRGPAYLVAVGGVLVILQIPLLEVAGPLLGMGLVLVGTFTSRGRATDPVARRRLGQAVALATTALLLTAVLLRATWAALPGELLPAWVSVVATTQKGLGILGTVLFTLGLGHESSRRGWAVATDAWWSATVAIVLVHGPILAAALFVHLAGRPGGVHGVRGVALFIVAVTPYVLIARAGARSGPVPSSPSPRVVAGA